MEDAKTLRDSMKNDLLSNGNVTEQKRKLDSCFSSNHVKYKRRKISAVRDFPKGCGRFSLSTSTILKIDTIIPIPESQTSVDPVNSLGYIELDSKMMKSEIAIEVKSDGKYLFDANKCPQSLTVDLSKITKQQESKPDRTKSLKENDWTEPLSKIDESMVLNKSDNCELLTQASSIKDTSTILVKEEPLDWRYPPRRRTSAIRDFPPGCGRNASVLSSEERLKINPLLNKVAAKLNNEESKPEIKMENEETGGEVIHYVKSEKNVSQQPDNGGDTGMNTIIEKRTYEQNYEKITEKQLDKENVNRKRSEEDKKQIKREVKNENVDMRMISKMDKKTSLSSKMVDLESQNQRKGKVSKEKSIQKSESTINWTEPDNSSDRELFSGKIIVQALMAAPFCPWRQGKRAQKVNSSEGLTPKKTRNSSSLAIVEYSEGKNQKRKKSHEKKKNVSNSSISSPHGEGECEGEESEFAHEGSEELSVSLIPFELHVSGTKSNNHGEEVVTRSKVRETLRLFQVICRKLLQEEEGKSKDQGNTSSKRIDLSAFHLLRVKNKTVNTGRKIVGSVPGVEVGDEFHYRVELCLIGLHRQIQGGIDYIKLGAGKLIATSIVASGGYADDMENSDVLVYSGQGGNPTGADKQPEDQKMLRGNLALKNSIDSQTPVRVISGFKENKVADTHDSKAKIISTYTYDGLYLVEKYWQERGQYGTSIFKFQLRRIPGQPELALKEVRKSRKTKVRVGLCIEDISQGKEKIPIGVVNTIDDEKPLPFQYTAKVINPSQYKPVPPRGCDCIDGCTDSEKCSCAVKNGGEIPYNYNGAIVEAKPLVFECGPSCKCPPSCHNRVSQNGLRFQLEVFKTESRGWGVRSLTSIPSGSFICEYTGELLHDKEAEERTGNDEYLFDIGQNYHDAELWDGLSTLIPDLQSSSCEVVEDVGFTIDAAQYGGVGRFINHSCSPNLYAQNVLYDHDDKRMPHIMFFAAENIPPLQELTYHYNYTIDQVHDSDGSIKKKDCYCGSHECTGRLY